MSDMCGCESWIIKKVEHRKIDAFELWCWRRLLRVPWTARRSNQSILKEISHLIFIGRTDVEAETPILWPPDAKSWLIWKDPDAGQDWGQEEKGMTKDEMVGWHHQHNGHRFGWTPGVGDGQGALACCGSWGHKESDTTERLKWTELPDSSVGKESACIAGDPHSIPGSGRSPGEGIGYPFQYSWASLVAQLVKNLPAMWETWVRPLGWEDPLEKGKATHSSILAWRILWTV